jgi:hypothetical protein
MSRRLKKWMSHNDLKLFTDGSTSVAVQFIELIAYFGILSDTSAVDAGLRTWNV